MQEEGIELLAVERTGLAREAASAGREREKVVPSPAAQG